jgi:hypothetical protein
MIYFISATSVSNLKSSEVPSPPVAQHQFEYDIDLR